ncbi:APH(3') family aminoglycoside O-phosphotransferase [Oceanirhabdus seepicola]|uniref:Aminoglycoside 3'-phosphotransferase n=1 Tax=Oceanirhabdus seepicola TaxID=2828781 RepID=A0A9J6NY10_9CLOT|nr:APH(3') family aminoglycoside O-phosphotransferase [Oceanirhabdus seepicola]MCM1988517.1 aminoglycoside 3'-phosphotransferase [Oceanirhabdus seepicola]
MKDNEFPKIIQKYIKDMTCIRDTIGCSESSVYCFTNHDNVLYLKVQKSSTEFEHEKKMIQWLQERLPTPQIVTQFKEQGYDYLLMTKAIGEMACSEKYLNDPEKLVRLLATGIKMLQGVDIAECPFDSTLKNKLNIAKKRVENNEVDMSDWEENTPFKSPKELYNYLVENQPDEELVFSHGDYCLPNVFFDNNKVTGFIDLGDAGIADKWQDIALCMRSLEHNLQNKKYIDLFFELIDIKPNYEKINYYILLDELF